MIGDLSRRQIEELLKWRFYGHLGCCTQKGMYIVPILYAYKDGAIYSHTYEGRKIRLMRQNPHVCFQVDRIDDLCTWKSVVAWGKFQELRGEKAVHAVRLLSRKLRHVIENGEYCLSLKRDGASHLSRRDGRKVVLYKIKVATITGRFERS